MLASRPCVDSEDSETLFRTYMSKRTSPSHVLEEIMELILIIVVLFVLFGGGGYWGYSRWR
jgi:hypothetical protein